MYKVIPIAVLVFLIGCTTTSQNKQHDSDKLIEFIKNTDTEMIAWGNQWVEDSVSLTVSTDYGFYAIDSNNIILSGSFANNAATVQSVLLKSSNGGKNWHEVMQPLASIHLERVLFTSNRHGFVVGDWATESTGEELVIYQTNDGGETWKALPAFRKPHYTCVCQLLAIDSVALKMQLLCYGGTPIDGIYIYRSTTGARTWTEQDYISYKEFDPMQKLPSPEYVPNPNFDGTEWKIELAGEKEYSVLSKKAGKWKTISKLPLKYQWKKGELSYK